MLRVDLNLVDDLVRQAQPVSLARKLSLGNDGKFKGRFQTLLNPSKHFSMYEGLLERSRFNAKAQLEQAKETLESARGTWEWFEKFAIAHQSYLYAENSVTNIRSSIRIEVLEEIDDALAVLSRDSGLFDDPEAVKKGILEYKESFINRIKTISNELNEDFHSLNRQASDIGGRFEKDWAVNAFREHRWNQIRTLAIHAYNKGRTHIVKRALETIPYFAM